MHSSFNANKMLLLFGPVETIRSLLDNVSNAHHPVLAGGHYVIMRNVPRSVTRNPIMACNSILTNDLTE